MNFGARVKQIREFRGMTQASLAQLIGSKQAVISALELRDSKTSDKLFEIAFALDVNPYWLQTGAGYPDKAPEWLVSFLLRPYLDDDFIEALKGLLPYLNQTTGKGVSALLHLVESEHHSS